MSHRTDTFSGVEVNDSNRWPEDGVGAKTAERNEVQSRYSRCMDALQGDAPIRSR